MSSDRAALRARAEQLVAGLPPLDLDRPALTLPSRSALTRADEVFRHWLGTGYDLDALHVVLAVTASERLLGDPVWLLYISGSGNAKTETVGALAGAGAFVTSTITSEAALLSGTSKREKSADANGGLLRRIGDRGVLVIKDVTSILSMNRDSRSGVLAALREMHDGHWERNIGTDGGRCLTWRGRLVVVGACTTSWDTHREVIATMGDRFVTLRSDSSRGRITAGRCAINNTGSETAMRAELAAAVDAVIRAVNPDTVIGLSPSEEDRILAAANVVTLARTACEYDYQGNVLDAHQPEMPTRFAKQLNQVFRGAVAIGLSRGDALHLAIRCARDSMPPLRLAILEDVATFANTPTRDVRRRLDKPRTTVDRQLQALHMLGLVACDEEDGIGIGGKPATTWRYSLAEGINLEALTVPEKSHHYTDTQEEGMNTHPDKSGTVAQSTTGGDDNADVLDI